MFCRLESTTRLHSKLVHSPIFEILNNRFDQRLYWHGHDLCVYELQKQDVTWWHLYEDDIQHIYRWDLLKNKSAATIRHVEHPTEERFGHVLWLKSLSMERNWWEMFQMGWQCQLDIGHFDVKKSGNLDMVPFHGLLLTALVERRPTCGTCLRWPESSQGSWKEFLWTGKAWLIDTYVNINVHRTCQRSTQEAPQESTPHSTKMKLLEFKSIYNEPTLAIL